jgi:hypothetical protein
VTFDSLGVRTEGPRNDEEDLNISELLMPVMEADAGVEETQNGNGQHDLGDCETGDAQEEETRGRSPSPSSAILRAKSSELLADTSSAAAWSGDEAKSPG